MRRTAALLAAALAVALLVPVAGPAGAFSPTAGPAPRSTGPQAPELSRAEALLSDGPPAADAPPASDAPAAAAPEREATMALRDLFLARPAMSGQDRRSADALLARPTVPGGDAYASYDAGTPTTQTCSDRICVTYVTTTPDRSTAAWAAQALSTVEAAWTRQVDEMGYRPPAGDGLAGGDGRFDVYLANISPQGFYGYCVPEDRVPGQPGRAQSYCVLDNDMAGFSMSPAESLTVTAAHEFFHAIQFNIDVREDQWFMEASATWIEEQVADQIDDNRQFLKDGQLGEPGTPLDTYSSSMAMYGNWIFVQRLAQSLGVDSVRQVWERLDASVGAPDEYSVQGIRNLISSRDLRWGKFYGRFVESNLVPRRFYDEGRAYRRAPISQRVRLRPGRTRTDFRVPVDHLASHTVRLKAARSLPARSRLHVRVDARKGRGATPVARLLVFKRGGGLSRVDIDLDRSGRGSRRVSLRRGKVRRVVLVLANASTRYRRCGGDSAWACGGRPADDGQRFRVRARVIR